MQLSAKQYFNQALIKMAVLLYQVDGMVSLSEQDYLEALVDDLDWQSPICSDAFLNDAIFQARQAIDTAQQREYLKSLKPELSFDVEKALEVAMSITGADGERSEKETELLSLLTHKLLAKELIAPSRGTDEQLAG